ncbi:MULTISPECIES: hypothetical protein [Cupriavidus]|uniref:Uncharacterized protein n=1 Tax=Cupriavidus basilensis TaxID=68895 RepID=A0A643FPF4_9BURK|nr:MULTISPECIES: hypothetical protein [Cupriavidus]MBB1632560.1 hypothetical protein [Cupriavidus sp. UME77]MCP3021628.1 hypothetical protein [Cupriavidus basilensis]MDR3382453.1 hypothetical protein [Cupriavidus basilensis]QOT79745.1 hypothetical protein F7R26_034260 [Cupriavidus basilensis]
MTLETTLQQFQDSLPGTDAFVTVKKATRELIDTDPAHAAAYFLLYGFARSYVLLYEDQAVTMDFAEAAKQELLGYMQGIARTLHGESAALLAEMNRIVSAYQGGKKTF